MSNDKQRAFILSIWMVQFLNVVLLFEIRIFLISLSLVHNTCGTKQLALQYSARAPWACASVTSECLTLSIVILECKYDLLIGKTTPQLSTIVFFCVFFYHFLWFKNSVNNKHQDETLTILLVTIYMDQQY